MLMAPSAFATPVGWKPADDADTGVWFSYLQNLYRDTNGSADHLMYYGDDSGEESKGWNPQPVQARVVITGNGLAGSPSKVGSVGTPISGNGFVGSPIKGFAGSTSGTATNRISGNGLYSASRPASAGTPISGNGFTSSPAYGYTAVRISGNGFYTKPSTR